LFSESTQTIEIEEGNLVLKGMGEKAQFFSPSACIMYLIGEERVFVLTRRERRAEIKKYY